ncbi:MAG: hypothetical protein M0P13_11710, partial [Fibrobacteraceae bacterium]|nr:hypothetical protein [Fibrobacteraceae bacterium]
MKHIFLMVPASAGVDLAKSAKSFYESVKKEVANAEFLVPEEKIENLLKASESSAAMEILVDLVQASKGDALVIQGVAPEKTVRSEKINEMMAAAVDTDVVVIAAS